MISDSFALIFFFVRNFVVSFLFFPPIPCGWRAFGLQGGGRRAGLELRDEQKNGGASGAKSRGRNRHSLLRGSGRRSDGRDGIGTDAGGGVRGDPELPAEIGAFLDALCLRYWFHFVGGIWKYPLFLGLRRTACQGLPSGTNHVGMLAVGCFALWQKGAVSRSVCQGIWNSGRNTVCFADPSSGFRLHVHGQPR